MRPCDLQVKLEKGVRLFPLHNPFPGKKASKKQNLSVLLIYPESRTTSPMILETVHLWGVINIKY